LYQQQGYAAYVLDQAMGSAQFWQKLLSGTGDGLDIRFILKST
jgi:hypothetical protein